MVGTSIKHGLFTRCKTPSFTYSRTQNYGYSSCKLYRQGRTLDSDAVFWGVWPEENLSGLKRLTRDPDPGSHGNQKSNPRQRFWDNKGASTHHAYFYSILTLNDSRQVAFTETCLYLLDSRSICRLPKSSLYFLWEKEVQRKKSVDFLSLRDLPHGIRIIHVFLWLFSLVDFYPSLAYEEIHSHRTTGFLEIHDKWKWILLESDLYFYSTFWPWVTR